MISEYSAGGVVFKKDQRLKTKSQRPILWLVAQHSQHKGWVFPKGFIGDSKEGETSEETAVREVEEETGVKAKIIKKLKKPATYFYVWRGEKRFKTVYYFLMEYESGNIKDHDFEMCDIKWLPEEKVKEILSYKTDQEAFKDALELYQELDK